MKKRQLKIENREYSFYQCHTLVVGSGAAALNCAYHLVNFGIEDVVIVTEQLGGGTSNNSGSDKQTYYKMSVFGDGTDSVYEMAETLFQGGAMHGDLALIEASLSVQEFFHLVQVGVSFPHTTYGGYVGYKTDHDPKQRATSAGPWTSNQMYACLLKEVQKEQIPILNEMEVVSLLRADDRVVGALALDKSKTELGLDSFVIFQAENIILGTGGPGGIYETSVYPSGHLGSTGIALEIGAEAVNLPEWQYGLASTKFRWNVSGSYQQVIPRYFSIDAEGHDEREFLNDYFPSMSKLATNIFLKGYQWPFDVRKIQNFGSSLIDILVYQETVVHGRRVFMDFRQNPSGSGSFGAFDLKSLEPEAWEYLEKSGALQERPIDRLDHMNPMAIDLYKQHGIDLWNEPLEVAVCAQHNNGGLKGNIWWESNIKHLFVIGEANGTHGVYRPGGSALNSGQVGGYRAAQYIAARYQESTLDEQIFLPIVTQKLAEECAVLESMLGDLAPTTRVTSQTEDQCNDLAFFRKEFQRNMTRVGAHIRDVTQIEEGLAVAKAQYSRIKAGQVRLHPAELLNYYQNRQLCLTQIAVLESLRNYIHSGGGSRGSYLILDPCGVRISDLLQWKYRPEAEELRKYVVEYQYIDGKHMTRFVPVRPIPEDNYWFERVWKSYLDKDIYDR